MSVSNEIFDRAFDIFQQFGPQRKIRVEKRWKKKIPQLLEDEYVNVKNKCQEIQNLAIDLGDQILNKKISFLEAETILKDKYPELTEERISRLINQGCYFASR